MMLDFKWSPFFELTLVQLYACLALRAAVFVVEQNCAFLDLDGRDFKAIHLLGEESGVMVAYLRFFPPSENEEMVSFGRILTAESVRKKGYGKLLMVELLKYSAQHFPGIGIQCSAQYRLKAFYESFGFEALGDIYLEDEIQHIAMRKQADCSVNKNQ